MDLTKLARSSRSRPQRRPEGSLVEDRTSLYGEDYFYPLLNGRLVAADEGSYYFATNPTIGTELVYAIHAAFADTSAAFVLYNSWTPGDAQAKRIYLDRLRLTFTGATPVVPASAISAQIAVRVDQTSRAPTAGAAAIITPVNVNADSGEVTRGQLYHFTGGVMTVPASGPAARTVARGILKPAIPVTQDELLAVFGGVDAPGGSVGTSAGKYVTDLSPVVIGPGQWAVVHLWFPSNATTAGEMEFDLGYFER